MIALETTQSKTGILEKPTWFNSKISGLWLKILKIKQILLKNSQKHLQVLLTNVYLRPRLSPKELKTHGLQKQLNQEKKQKDSSTNSQHQVI